MKDNTILTEEERVELRNVYANLRGYDFDLEEAELSGEAESLKNEAIRNEWDTLYEAFKSLLAKKVEEEFYLAYLADGFDRGWEAYCKRYNIEFNPQIMMIEKNKWNDEVNKRRKWDYR